MIKVLIIDDHSIIRKGLKDILEEDRSISVGGEATTIADGLDTLRKEHYDVILLDINLPDGKGTDAIGRMKEIRPDVKILILSMYEEDKYAVRALRSGASGYLRKDCEPPELLEAVRKVYGGGHYITPELSDLLVNTLHEDASVPAHQRLSDREYQIFLLIASGERIKDIADRLALSPKTVSTYRSRILEKLSLNTDADLVLYAEHHGLL